VIRYRMAEGEGNRHGRGVIYAERLRTARAIAYYFGGAWVIERQYRTRGGESWRMDGGRQPRPVER
jgi:hypothetical protein